MTAVDPDRLRVAFQRMNRDELLGLLDRAINLIPKSRLAEFAEGFVSPEEVAQSKPTAKRLLTDVRAFHSTAMGGHYYESFRVNSKNFMDMSPGTEHFIAEFKRMTARCVKAADESATKELREAFELLFALLRNIDEGHDDVVFFADEAGSWQVGVDWNKSLPAYFKCLAATTTPEDFARLAEAAITEFADYDRVKLLAGAGRICSKEQALALKTLASARQQRP